MASCVPDSIIHHIRESPITARTIDDSISFSRVSFLNDFELEKTRDFMIIPPQVETHLFEYMDSFGVSIDNCHGLAAIASPYINIHLSSGTMSIYPIDFFHYHFSTGACHPKYCVFEQEGYSLIVIIESLPAINDFVFQGDRYFCDALLVN